MKPVDLWRHLPAAVRAQPHRAVQALSRAAVPLWVRLNWSPGKVAGADDAVTVAGLMRSSIGIGQGARLLAAALAEGGVRTRGYDAGPALRITADLEAPTGLPAADASPGGVIVSHLNPPELIRLLEATRGRVLKRTRHVGYWAWELPVAPADWRPAFDYVDEIWAPSRFTAEALRAIAPASAAIHVVPHPVWAEPLGVPDRAGFGLPTGACLVLVALDLRSTAARKNPTGALEAYRRAVPKPARGVAVLVCKISGADAEPGLVAALRAQNAERPDIVLLDEVLSAERMRALVASVDIVFSPHRAEGFGLLLAEGMRMGKAVVATGWSGNMDFMDRDFAALIDHRLVAAVDPQGLYRDAQWAEPDLDHAARLLGDLIADPAARGALGERARTRGGPVFDPAAWRALASARLSR